MLHFLRNALRRKDDGRERPTERRKRVRKFHQDERRLCVLCNGRGQCHRCHGEAVLFHGERREPCFECQGTAECRVCGGSGYR